MITKEDIQLNLQKFLPRLIEIRHHLHQNPELSFQEFKTAEYIKAILDEFEIPYQSEIAGTGIVAELKGKNSSSDVLMLRGDMDALPIQEENTVSYASRVPGVMHACGHDVHITCILGVLLVLNAEKDKLKSTIKFIFQPGEEKLPGGASLMIKEGVLKHPVPKAIIGQHVFPELETGKVGFRSGMYMASTDELYLHVEGKGGHAALPHQYNNPLLIAAEFLIEAHNLFMNPKTKETPEAIPTVLAFGKIEGLGATNVIPNAVNIQGTFRTMNEEWRSQAHAKLEALAAKVAKNNSAIIKIDIQKGYPFLVNDDATTQYWRNKALEFLGEENVVDLDLRMTAEDFAWYSQEVPACFYRLGTRNEANKITSSVHTSTFDIDENAIEIGVGLMAFAAGNY